MHIQQDTLDDILNDVYTKLLETPFDVPTSRSLTSEIVGAVICLKNPLARISRTESRGLLFSALGEFLWYMKGDNTLAFIEYYIPRYQQESENGIVSGAYGPRLFGLRNINQISNVISLLKQRNTSRRAVIQLFSAEDIVDTKRKEIPCTCTLQFMIRSGNLHLVTYMRSNDAYMGLPHDIFAFTMIQELVARILGVELGFYTHMAGSLHLYACDIDKAKQYLELGFQSTQLYMPKMPEGDNFSAVNLLLTHEEAIRKSDEIRNFTDLPEYWADLARLLQIFKYGKEGALNKIELLKEKMSSKSYMPYIDKRLAKLWQNSVSLNE